MYRQCDELGRLVLPNERLDLHAVAVRVVDLGKDEQLPRLPDDEVLLAAPDGDYRRVLVNEPRVGVVERLGDPPRKVGRWPWLY